MKFEHLFIMILMIILSYQDIQNLEIDIFPFIILNILLIYYGTEYLSTLITLTILNIIYILQHTKIGYADIILISTSANFIAPAYLGIYFLLMSFSGIFILKFKKLKKIPFIPFISLSFLILNFKTFLTP